MMEVLQKSVLAGTHRICQPEETLARVQPFLAQIGITRVADVTYLDDLGIPVFQAIRPNSRNLSIAQGKGLTRTLAKVSAIMESIEGWHAEQPELVSTYATVGDMTTRLPYTLSQLNLHKHHLLHDALKLEWFPASILRKAELSVPETYVPADLVRLDFTVRSEWHPPLFVVCSNGLASGNTFEEAVLHALYEIIERDTFERVRRGSLQKTEVDPDTVDAVASTYLIEKLHQAQATIQIFFACGPTGLPCFEATISSPGYPVVAGGYGCHLDRDVALSRALTEAAQSRLTMIAGSRDDLRRSAYSRLQSQLSLRRLKDRLSIPSAAQPAQPAHQLRKSFRDISSSASSSLQEDLLQVIRCISRVFPCSPLVVDFTRRELAIPVMFVIVPQALFLEGLK